MSSWDFKVLSGSDPRLRKRPVGRTLVCNELMDDLLNALREPSFGLNFVCQKKSPPPTTLRHSGTVRGTAASLAAAGLIEDASAFEDAAHRATGVKWTRQVVPFAALDNAVGYNAQAKGLPFGCWHTLTPSRGGVRTVNQAKTVWIYGRVQRDVLKVCTGCDRCEWLGTSERYKGRARPEHSQAVHELPGSARGARLLIRIGIHVDHCDDSARIKDCSIQPQ
jgi:hypothetical protein